MADNNGTPLPAGAPYNRGEQLIMWLGGEAELPPGAPYNRDEQLIMWLRDAIAGSMAQNYVSTELQELTEAQKVQALLNLDSVRIVKLDDGTIPLAEITDMIVEINERGEHVFFDTAALAYPLYLCTIAINYESNTPVSYRLNDLVSGNISIGAYDGTKTLAQVLAGAVNAFYTLTVTAVTQDGVTVTGQTVTVRVGSETGSIYATAAYEGQPVSFSVPNGFEYFVSITSNLAGHFNPTTASGVVSGVNVSVTLTYSDLHSIQSFADVKDALDLDLDLTGLVGQQVHWTRNSTQENWDVADYDGTNKVVTLLLHDTLPDQLVFEPEQALAWFESGLVAGNYKFKHSDTYYYFTLATDIPSGGQLKATTSTFQTYADMDTTTALETGTVSDTEIAGATDLGTTGSESGTYPLNSMSRVTSGSNNFGESGLLQWLNSDDLANTPMPRLTKFSRPYSVNVAGLLAGVSAEDLACIADTTWKCSANKVYECPAALGGIATKGAPYTVTAKIALASEKEIFGSYSGVDAGDSIFDLYVGAEDADRIKYYNNSVRRWWLRSPNADANITERYVYTSGDARNAGVSVVLGVVPACKIAKSN